MFGFIRGEHTALACTVGTGNSNISYIIILENEVYGCFVYTDITVIYRRQLFKKKIVLFHYLVSSGKLSKKIKRVEYLYKSTGHLTFDNKIISQKS